MSVSRFSRLGVASLLAAALSAPVGAFAAQTTHSYNATTPPTTTSPRAPLLSFSTGPFHACGVETGGAVACWGRDKHSNATPPRGVTFTQVSAGYNHTCGVKTNRSVTCWGLNSSREATPPAGAFAQVSAGYDHTCGLKTNGTAACWGANDFGQLNPPRGVTFAVRA